MNISLVAKGSETNHFYVSPKPVEVTFYKLSLIMSHDNQSH